MSGRIRRWLIENLFFIAAVFACLTLAIASIITLLKASEMEVYQQAYQPDLLQVESVEKLVLKENLPKAMSLSGFLKKREIPALLSSAGVVQNFADSLQQDLFQLLQSEQEVLVPVWFNPIDRKVILRDLPAPPNNEKAIFWKRIYGILILLASLLTLWFAFRIRNTPDDKIPPPILKDISLPD